MKYKACDLLVRKQRFIDGLDTLPLGNQNMISWRGAEEFPRNWRTALVVKAIHGCVTPSYKLLFNDAELVSLRERELDDESAAFKLYKALDKALDALV